MHDVMLQQGSSCLLDHSPLFLPNSPSNRFITTCNVKKNTRKISQNKSGRMMSHDRFGRVSKYVQTDGKDSFTRSV